MINLIAAFSENYVIGNNNILPWSLPKDLKRFKEITWNHPIIMGRKTFFSLSKILPNRTHIVISRKYHKFSTNIILTNSLYEAINKAFLINKNIFIIGGGEIYKQSIKFVDYMFLTKIHTISIGNVFFPILDFNNWELINSEFHSKNSLHKYDFTFLTYKKK